MVPRLDAFTSRIGRKALTANLCSPKVHNTGGPQARCATDSATFIVARHPQSSRGRQEWCSFRRQRFGGSMKRWVASLVAAASVLLMVPCTAKAQDATLSG